MTNSKKRWTTRELFEQGDRKFPPQHIPETIKRLIKKGRLQAYCTDRWFKRHIERIDYPELDGHYEERIWWEEE